MRRTGSDYLKFVSIILFSILIVGYFIFNFRIFIAGPEIIVTSPQSGRVTDTELLEIVGKAENVNFISLNDKPIFVDGEGNFKEFLLLSSGYNIIVIKAQDKFERKISKNIEVIFNGQSINREDVINIETKFSTSTDSETSTLENNATSSPESNSE